MSKAKREPYGSRFALRKQLSAADGKLECATWTILARCERTCYVYRKTASLELLIVEHRDRLLSFLIG